MAWIALEGMRFHAYHGVYEAERVLGTDYILDVYIRTNINPAAQSDQVENTVNYESVYRICELEMDEPKNLIETVVGNIAGKMKAQFDNMEALRIRLRKVNPPLGGRVDASQILEELNFLQQCPKCQQPFILYEKGQCWEKHPNLHPATRETLERQFGGKCLCDNCLKEYVG